MRSNLVTLNLLGDNDLPVRPAEDGEQDSAKNVSEAEVSNVLGKDEHSLKREVFKGIKRFASDMAIPLHHLMLTLSLLVTVGVIHASAHLLISEANLLSSIKSIEYYIFCFALGTNGAKFMVSFLISSFNSIRREIKDVKSIH